MKKEKWLLLLLLLVVLFCACEQSDIEETKREDSKVMDTVVNVVNKKDFVSASVDDQTKIVDLEISDTQKPSEIRKEINNRLKKQNIKPYTINISGRNMEQVKKENRWYKINGDIDDELRKKEEYKGVTIQNSDISLKQPPTLVINAPINSFDSGAKKYAKKIETEIYGLLKTNKMKKWVKEDPYKIEVYSRDKQIIN
ncbi:DUF4030 domain-containing protein [Bacillus gaemokensis]|uniref:DUF4030 domain-containing protein n=1 Tax=Bacillus gaemokensis TaxID=574375 RepID=A0A073K6J1_9BACI|nr:DUF4030 domain-containing protein [Bacillus gaemokensis]KEK22067.1 hypothetical protein BAGA_22505 [Bacillus gaemokensis]KYG37768.1 hypothetical protein AZF08_21790 [Bacillus gaemokensis]